MNFKVICREHSGSKSAIGIVSGVPDHEAALRVVRNEIGPFPTVLVQAWPAVSDYELNKRIES